MAFRKNTINSKIRKTLHGNEWWFVLEDVVLALIESRDPKQYIQRMKQRDPELATKRTRALYKAKGYSDDWEVISLAAHVKSSKNASVDQL